MRLVSALLLVTLTACTGKIAGPAASATGVIDACAAGAPDIPQAPLRRLSQSEYLATVSSLFPGIQLPSLTIATDPNDHGFLNRAALLNPEPLLIEDYSDAAAEIAAAVIATPSSILSCTPSTPAEQAGCAATFVSTVGERIFRRPLTSDEQLTYTGFLAGRIAAGDPFNGAVQLTLEAMLQAPPFLYRLEFGVPDPAVPGRSRLTSFEVATRLSYLFWGSAPDATLLAKAAGDQLETPEAREAEGRRLLADPRARDMLVEFHNEWLGFDLIAAQPKDPTVYPTYTASLEGAIREESNRFVADVVWSGDGTLNSLLTSTATEVNAPLAQLYGVAGPASGWAPATLDPSQRAGILTRADFLAGRAHKLEGSPPLRANYVLGRFLCQSPPPPPANANLTEPAASVDGGAPQTNRELFEARLSPAECASCHSTFTGLGYTFENYDAIGRYRTVDNGLPVDATGTFHAGTLDWQMANALDLSAKLAASAEVQACVTSYWFAYAEGRVTQASDACALQGLGRQLSSAQGDVRELLIAIAKGDDFLYRPVVTP